MNFDINVSVPALTVFLQGLLSFFSPCVLPLIPVYFGYLSGGTATEGEDGRLYFDRKKVFVNTLFFVLGVSFAFFLLGLGMSVLGGFFSRNRLLFARVGGAVVILLGLYQLGLFGSGGFLSREKGCPSTRAKPQPRPLRRWFWASFSASPGLPAWVPPWAAFF